jgi:hypothetical protein
MDPTLAITAIVICTRLARLGALALRLRSGTRRLRQQLDCLTTLALRLPLGALLELDDPHDHGTQLRLRTSTRQYRQQSHA